MNLKILLNSAGSSLRPQQELRVSHFHASLLCWLPPGRGLCPFSLNGVGDQGVGGAWGLAAWPPPRAWINHRAARPPSGCASPKGGPRDAESDSLSVPSQAGLRARPLSTTLIKPVFTQGRGAHQMFLPIPKYGHGRSVRGCLLCKARGRSPDNATSSLGAV